MDSSSQSGMAISLSYPKNTNCEFVLGQSMCNNVLHYHKLLLSKHKTLTVEKKPSQEYDFGRLLLIKFNR